MKRFEEPRMEIESIQVEDVITASFEQNPDEGAGGDLE